MLLHLITVRMAALMHFPLLISLSGTAKTRVEEGKMGKNVLKICFLLSTFVVKAKIQKKPKIKDKYLWVAVVQGWSRRQGCCCCLLVLS